MEEEFTNCCICCDRFSHLVRNGKAPIVGKCGDCICRSCLSRIRAGDMAAKKKANKGDYKGDFIDCPLCKTKRSFAFKNLTPNRNLIRYLEEQQRANASATTANVASRSETASDSTAGHPKGRQPPTTADPKITPREPKRRRVAPDRFEPPAFSGVTADRGSTRTRDTSKSSTGEPNNDKSSHDKTSASPTIGRGIVSRVIHQFSHDETSASPAIGRGIGSLVIPGSIVEVVSCRSTSRDTTYSNQTASDPTVAAADEAANNDGKPTAEENATSNGEPTVKKEKDLILKQALKHRKYGNRVLLARQAKNGMLKMGGGNVRMIMYPSESAKNDNHPRYRAIGSTIAIAFDDSWNRFGPKYAGQPSAHLSYLAGLRDEPFSVFMKRCIKTNTGTKQLLGWEYCGEYKSADPEQEIILWNAAYSMSKRDKAWIVDDILNSAAYKDDGGGYRLKFLRLRGRLDKALAEDDSPAGPEWLIAGRVPTEEETKVAPTTLAAQARALGFTHDMPMDDLVRLWVNLDEFHETEPIVFVGYNEKVYDYIKEGETTRDKFAKMRTKTNRSCAKASDWYAWFDGLIS
jgi:hypothetical protein